MARVNVPTVLQLEAVECGAASLAMILAYHGRHMSLEQLRVACGVSRDGTKAVNILKAARALGFTAKGFKKEVDELRDVPLPAILFWNFNHFVVLEGFGRGCFYLNDPGRGKTRVGGAEFDRSFTGVVLTFERIASFRPGGQPARLWRSLAARLPGSGKALTYAVLTTAALAIPGLIAPGFQRIFVDHILIGSTRSWLGPLSAAMAAAAVAAAMLTWLQQRALLRLEMRLAADGSSRFLRHVLALPIDFFMQRSAADISARVQVNDSVASLLSGELATAFVSVLTAGLYAALMFRYEASLAWLAIAIAVLNLGALLMLSRKRLETSERLQQDRGRLLGTSMNGLLSIETLKSTGSETDFFAKWSGLQAAVVNREQSRSASALFAASVPELLMALGSASVLALGGLRVMEGALTMGLLAAFQALVRNFLAPVNQLVQTGGSLPEAHAGMRRLDDVLRYPREPEPDGGAPEEKRLEGRVELRGVTFGYSRLEPPLIEGFDLTIEPGRRVALVGGSGSGKSTVARIVAGLLQPWSGGVLFDGAPRRGHSRAVMSASVATVDQEIFLFEGTVRENLSLWDAGVPPEVIVEAARDACIHGEIAARPGGYDSAVEESGRNFSGGQRQRLEIARALVNEPRVLVMDEATSALDPKTEQAVSENLRRRGCACLIVAHRLSTIRDCDEIVVLDRGRVIERGTHEQLCAAGGAYSRLIAVL